MSLFQLSLPFQPAGDQPEAIKQLVSGFKGSQQFQTLLGVTGSGKTFTMANVIQQLNKPTLIISHNKTLAAQLYQEFKAFFPLNAVEYFVSYYDYYQPEAYVPSSDTYIEKDSSINEEIDKLRLRATASLMSRKDVIVVASVSCIYGLGTPAEYKKMMVEVRKGQVISRSELLKQLVAIYYTRNDIDLRRGTFRPRGDTVEIHPAYDDFAWRIELFGDDVERITRVNTLTGEIEAELNEVLIYPARHYVTAESNMERIVKDIRYELDGQLKVFTNENKLLEAQRINSRTHYDIEMLKEVGFCSGIENYSRIIENRAPGSCPSTLMDFFGDDYLLMIDESHVTIPQVGAMYAGDRSRKTTLVDFGFRLPSAMDNRPLKFTEFEERMPQTLFVSATPAPYELKKSDGVVVEQIIRPTGLLDPMIEVRPSKGQIDDVMNEVKLRTEAGERTLVTTLTKKSAEALTEYLQQAGVKVMYMHSDTETLRRSEIVKQLRQGGIDVLVGINLLREGLDLPEVSLVVILDADKEGFLRSKTSLVQTIGRAARHLRGTVLLYADRMTDSMTYAIAETTKRRSKQEAHNRKMGIEPKSISKAIHGDMSLGEVPGFEKSSNRDEKDWANVSLVAEPEIKWDSESVETLRKRMKEAASQLNFELAAEIRDLIKKRDK